MYIGEILNVAVLTTAYLLVFYLMCYHLTHLAGGFS